MVRKDISNLFEVRGSRFEVHKWERRTMNVERF